MTLEEFKKQTFNKKCWILSIEYLKKCSENKPFVNKKPSKSFFAVRAFMLKLEISELDNLYAYLTTIQGQRLMSLTDLFHKAEERTQKARTLAIANNKPSDYESKSVLDWLNG